MSEWIRGCIKKTLLTIYAPMPKITRVKYEAKFFYKQGWTRFIPKIIRRMIWECWYEIKKEKPGLIQDYKGFFAPPKETEQ